MSQARLPIPAGRCRAARINPMGGTGHAPDSGCRIALRRGKCRLGWIFDETPGRAASIAGTCPKRGWPDSRRILPPLRCPYYFCFNLRSAFARSRPQGRPSRRLLVILNLSLYSCLSIGKVVPARNGGRRLMNTVGNTGNTETDAWASAMAKPMGGVRIDACERFGRRSYARPAPLHPRPDPSRQARYIMAGAANRDLPATRRTVNASRQLSARWASSRRPRRALPGNNRGSSRSAGAPSAPGLIHRHHSRLTTGEVDYIVSDCGGARYSSSSISLPGRQARAAAKGR